MLRRSVQIKEKLLSKLMQVNPELKELYATKLEDMRQWNCTIQNASEITNLNTRLKPMLDQLESQLSQTDWLCGDSYSLADTVWTAVLNRLDELKIGHLWQDITYPMLSSYFNQLRARPSFNTAIQDDKMPLPMLLVGLRKIFLSI